LLKKWQPVRGKHYCGNIIIARIKRTIYGVNTPYANSLWCQYWQIITEPNLQRNHNLQQVSVCILKVSPPCPECIVDCDIYGIFVFQMPHMEMNTPAIPIQVRLNLTYFYYFHKQSPAINHCRKGGTPICFKSSTWLQSCSLPLYVILGPTSKDKKMFCMNRHHCFLVGIWHALFVPIS
jgi:hypothetical protein